MKMFILLGVLGLANVSYAQTTKSAATQPANTPAKPCGMTPEVSKVIGIVGANGLVGKGIALNDPRVDNILRNFSSYMDQTLMCRATGRDDAAKLKAADDLSLLLMFESGYNEARYEDEAALNKQLSSRIKLDDELVLNDGEEIGRLQKPPGALYEQPTPIHMTCQFVFPGPSLKCSGEVFSPRPLPMLPFSMSCHNAAPGEVSCDGDIEPPIGMRIR
jgi:hypothetical protein